MTYEEKKSRAFKLIQNDKYLKAFEEFSSLYMENPKDPEVLEVSIFLFDRIMEGNYDFEPTTAEQFVFRGVAKFYKTEFAESIVDYDKALQINSKLDYALKCKAFSLRFLRKYTLSIVELEKAIQIKPAGEYFDDLAEVYSIIGDNKNAIENHEKAIAHSPDDPRLFYNYGTHLGKIGKIEKALRMFDRAIELWPQYDDALHNRKYYSKLL